MLEPKTTNESRLHSSSNFLGTDSSINQIEINENILYVLDTRGHNIHMFEITYE